MGFKTSCSTLGRFYEIYTRPIGQDIEYHTSFDISEYTKRDSGADAWDVTIEDRKRFAASPLGSAQHGSAFVITRLRTDKGKNYASAVLAYLGEAFKPHLEHGDEIFVEYDSGEGRERKKLSPSRIILSRGRKLKSMKPSVKMASTISRDGWH